ncbi:MAG: hypothetical protein WAL39_03760, partial [Xanthobacteraceae bacterium]
MEHSLSLFFAHDGTEKPASLLGIMRSGHFKTPLRCSTTALAVCHCMRLKAGGEKMTNGNLTIQNGIAYA